MLTSISRGSSRVGTAFVCATCRASATSGHFDAHYESFSTSAATAYPRAKAAKGSKSKSKGKEKVENGKLLSVLRDVLGAEEGKVVERDVEPKKKDVTKKDVVKKDVAKKNVVKKSVGLEKRDVISKVAMDKVAVDGNPGWLEKAKKKRVKWAANAKKENILMIKEEMKKEKEKKKMKKLEKANLPAKAGDTDVDLIRLVKEKDALLKLIEARIKTNKKAKTGDAVFRKVQMKEKETKPRVEPVDVLELTRTASADAKRMGKDATIRMRRKRLRIKAKEGNKSVVRKTMSTNPRPSTPRPPNAKLIAKKLHENTRALRRLAARRATEPPAKIVDGLVKAQEDLRIWARKREILRAARGSGSLIRKFVSESPPTKTFSSVRRTHCDPKAEAEESVRPQEHLVTSIQSGRLNHRERLEAVRKLRASLLQRQPPAENLPDKKINPPEEKGRQKVKPPEEKNRQKGYKTGPLAHEKSKVTLDVKSISAHDLKLLPIEKVQEPVPGVGYGLERALFNPGIYHLQDPRSRVYNFDPYLEKITPVDEFDFNALKEYITSSRDKTLLQIAREEKRKYTGSTSSTTSALSHFHFLLSQWRPIDTSALARGFPVTSKNFTLLQRAPTAVFLRNRDGVYAIDADKQYDTPNILSSLGKSMEKLLTLPTEDYEKYLKKNSHQISKKERTEPESFHYSTIGDFLLRSQLDAYDPRLPGTGMYDLKTRACVSIRMDVRRFEQGKGYEIKGRTGELESFDREYYDMIRSAFLKYSLQVRMGRMNGIFVAFHNIERIFGFQYISLAEMNQALHGTEDEVIGDSEFKLSLTLLNKVLDRATEKYPGQSLRVHFETRESSQTPFMYIFAEPVTEEEIDRIQNTGREAIDKFEQKILGLPARAELSSTEEEKKAEWELLRAKVEECIERDELDAEAGRKVAGTALEESEHWDDLTPEETEKCIDLLSTMSREEVLADVEEQIDTEASDLSLDNGFESREESSDLAVVEDNETTLGDFENQEILEEQIMKELTEDTALVTTSKTDNIDQPVESGKPLLGMTLTIRNKIDGQYAERPTDLSNDQKWVVEYAIDEIPNQDRAWRLYKACQLRRETVYTSKTKKGGKDMADQEGGDQGGWNDSFMQLLKKTTAQGRVWREEQDVRDAEKGQVVLESAFEYKRKLQKQKEEDESVD